jgi:hypothetical protein
VRLFWLENPGPAKALEPPNWTRHVISHKGQLFFAIGDIDGDGRFEIFHGHAVKFLLVQDGEAWSEIPVRTPRKVENARSANLADVDGDGYLDAVCTGVPHHIVHFNGSLDPRDWSVTLITNSLGDKPDRSVVFDIDGDGDLDFASTEENYRGTGLGVFWHENPQISASRSKPRGKPPERAAVK